MAIAVLGGPGHRLARVRWTPCHLHIDHKVCFEEDVLLCYDCGRVAPVSMGSGPQICKSSQKSQGGA